MAAISTDTDRLSAEYRALKETCGLLDRSERGKLALTGGEAREFLNGQVTNDILTLTPGTGCYAAFLTPKGKMLGDLRVLDLGPDGLASDENSGEELFLDTERVALQALFDMIRRFKIGYDVELHKRTLERGLVSLIGPDSADVAGVDALPKTEHANMPIQIGDGERAGVIEAIAVRTNTGIDLVCDAADTSALTDMLQARGAIPVSEDAAEIIRVERGRPRYGIDLDETVIPQEAGLNERAVSFTKGCYVGQETVARLHYKGHPNRHLRGLRLRAADPRDVGSSASVLDAGSVADVVGAQLRLGERTVGRLTSAVISPTYGPIGLGLVRREAEPGVSMDVDVAGVSAEIVELPFGAPIAPIPPVASRTHTGARTGATSRLPTGAVDPGAAS